MFNGLLLLMGCLRGGMESHELAAPHSQCPSVHSSKMEQGGAESTYVQIAGNQGASVHDELQSQWSTPCMTAERIQQSPTDSQQQQQQQQQQQLQVQLRSIVETRFCAEDDAPAAASPGGSAPRLLPPCTPPRTEEARKHAKAECVQPSPGSFDLPACSRRSSSPAFDTATSSFVSAAAGLQWTAQGPWCVQGQHGTSSPSSSGADPNLAVAERRQQRGESRPSFFTASQLIHLTAAADDDQIEEEDGWGHLDPTTCSWDRSFCSVSSASFSDPYKHGRMISEDFVGEARM